MRRTTPDLTGSRKTVYHAVSVGLMTLTILYVLWTNYVMFVGGNLPLTNIHLSDGSTGGGLAMLLIGDLIIVLLVWLLLDGVLLNLLYMVLVKGQPRSAEPERQNAWQGGPSQAAWPQGQPQNPPPYPPGQWQGQPPQGNWQGQPPQGNWQGQPPQGWGPPPPPAPPAPSGPYPPSGEEAGRLVGPGTSGRQSPGSSNDQGFPENSPR